MYHFTLDILQHSCFDHATSHIVQHLSLAFSNGTKSGINYDDVCVTNWTLQSLRRTKHVTYQAASLSQIVKHKFPTDAKGRE